MSKFMVIGNHRSNPEFYGLFSSQSEAVEKVNFARNSHRDKDHPLRWTVVTDNDNQFGMSFYLSAWDGTFTTTWLVVEVYEPRQSLDEMFNDELQLHINRPIPVGANAVKAWTKAETQAAWDAYAKELERDED